MKQVLLEETFHIVVISSYVMMNCYLLETALLRWIFLPLSGVFFYFIHDHRLGFSYKLKRESNNKNINKYFRVMTKKVEL